MVTLSIIIPVYNKVEYIDSCLDAVLKQTFHDFELLLINDGSTDGSAEKCDLYAKRDKRIKVWHQKNQGVSSARNFGIDKASGDYIGFVDSDDIIEPDMYEVLVTNALSSLADISACGMKVYYSNEHNNDVQVAPIQVMDNSKGVSALLKGDLHWSANNKIYRASLAKQVRFEGAINEDVLYNFYAFLQAGKSVFQDVIKYKYIVRSNSVSMSKFSSKYMQTIAVSKKIVSTVSEKMPEHLEVAKALDFSKNISLFNLILSAGREAFQAEYEVVLGNLNSYSEYVKDTAILPKKQRIAFWLIKRYPRIYSRLLRLYCLVAGSDLATRTNG